MSRSLALALLWFAFAGRLIAEDQTPQPTPQKRGGWFTRMLHPFQSSNPTPNYKDARLRGLVLDLKLSPQPVKLSEVRQLEVKITLNNVSKRAVSLDFPTDQRFEIYLKNSSDAVLTTWSDNHAFNANAGTVLINPGEHVYYPETIATRELTPNKVFIVEVFFPQYPELRIRQKFLTAP
jgi:intracellular proteinase inhibitor BsuPI